MKKPHMSKGFSYEDYKLIHDIFIEEELDQEDIDDGLVPETYHAKVCFTNHSLYRMNDDYEREVEWEALKPIFLGASEGLLSLRTGDTFELFSKERDIKIVGIFVLYDNKINLIVKTVIRQLQSNGSYKKVKPTKSKNNTIIREE